MPSSTDPKPVALSFYRELAKQGFTADQVVDLATRLLDHVRDDLTEENERRAQPLVAK